MHTKSTIHRIAFGGTEDNDKTEGDERERGRQVSRRHERREVAHKEGRWRKKRESETEGSRSSNQMDNGHIGRMVYWDHRKPGKTQTIDDGAMRLLCQLLESVHSHNMYSHNM